MTSLGLPEMDFVWISVCGYCWHPITWCTAWYIWYIHSLSFYLESLSIFHRFYRRLSLSLYDHLLPNLESKQTLQSKHVSRWCYGRWGYDQRHPSKNAGNRRLGAVSYIYPEYRNFFLVTFPASHSFEQAAHFVHAIGQVTIRKKESSKLGRDRRLLCDNVYCERKADKVADHLLH